MFVKYGAGKSGIVEYLKLGVSKDRDFSRDEMDYRQIIDGNIEELDYILTSFYKPKTTGDNYKHFVITFDDENTINDDLINITQEFKKFATAGYKKDEIYFYAEAHIPKLKGYPFRSGEYNSRKPHVHVIIPVYNLYTGNKGYNFNINTFEYRKYLDNFSKIMNFKYNLNSPYEIENRRLLNSKASLMAKKSGKPFSTYSLKLKNDLIKLIVTKKIENVEQLIKIAKIYHPEITHTKKGDINKEIYIIEANVKGEHFTIPLNDFVFSKDFMCQTKEKQNELYNSFLLKNSKVIQSNEILKNSKTTIKEYQDNEYFKNVVAKLIKYSKIKPNIVQQVKSLDKKQTFELIKQVELDFYKGIIKSGRKINTRRNIIKDIRTASANIKKFEFNTKTKYDNSQLSNRGIKNSRKCRIKPIYELNVNLDILNKIMEIKFGSTPINNFYKNYNLLSLIQKSELYRFVGENIKQLKELNKPITISNFYNNELDNLLMDNYKAWLKLNNSKMSNKSKGITDEDKNIDFNKLNELKKQQDLVEKEYKQLRKQIEEIYQYQSKVKRKKLKELQDKYKNLLKKEKYINKVTRENIQIHKPSLRNNTIVDDSYLQFLQHCLDRNIVIPESNKLEIIDYLKIVELCKNKINSNNKDIDLDINENEIDFDFTEGYEEYLIELEERIEKLKEDEIEVDEKLIIQKQDIFSPEI